MSVDLFSPFRPQSAKSLLQHVAESAPSDIDRDVYGVGTSLQQFEKQIANTLGKEQAVFMVSGVMSQLIALKIHSSSVADEKTSFLCHATSHLMIYEQDSYKHLLNMTAITVGEKHRALTIEDFTALPNEAVAKVHTIILELPQRENGGLVPSWKDFVAISEFAKQRGIKLHMDGARLWECQPFYDLDYSAICAVFDSVYVSFYKGIGAMSGAMLAADANFISSSKVWQRRFGGNLYTVLPVTAHAQECFNARIHTFRARYEKLREVVAALTEWSEAQQDTLGYRPLTFNPPVPQCSMVHVHIKGASDVILAASKVVAERHDMLVLNRLRSLVGLPADCSGLEWNMGTDNMSIPTPAFVEGWTALFAAIQELQVN
eukprot:GILK01009299.1.p1 GENE.GILK01009299.1~~GILK01009299.1.p1  ORF type:complete len:375 (+),score=38.40 GILK01009299.1:28-1152(+)